MSNNFSNLFGRLSARRERSERGRAKRYGVALLLMSGAFLLRVLLNPILQQRHPYLLFLPAALLAGWYGRFGPAMLVLFGGYLLGDFFFGAPLYQFGPYSSSELVTILTYTTLTLVGTSILEAYHRTQDRLELAQQYGVALEKEIKEREQAEAARQKSEQEYRLLFESNPLPTWVFDREDLTFMAVNEAAIRHYGYTREEFLGASIMTIRPPEDIPALKEHIRSMKQDWEFAGVWKHRKKDGSIIEVEITSHNLQFGGRAAVLVLANDVTDKRRAERELHEAKDELRRYATDLEQRVAERTASLEASVKSLEGVLYHVAHDLRAPLRAMNGFTHLLVDYCRGDPACANKDFADRIMEASETMDEKIHDLLEFGRLGHQQVIWMVIDTSAVLQRLLGNLRGEIGAKRASVTVDEPLPQVLGDPAMIEQVLTQLVRNALLFVAPEKSPALHIWGEQKNGKARVYVEDNGIGIESKYHDKVFGLFEQLHKPGKYPGNGMGLAIARKAMERMRGNIGFSSKAGEGSCFWIEFGTELLATAEKIIQNRAA